MRGRLEKVLARRLREIAALRGLPLSHVADRAGVARSYFWLLLDGSSSATLDAVQRLAETLEVEPLALLAATTAAQVSARAAEPTAKKKAATRITRERSTAAAKTRSPARTPSKRPRRAGT